MPIRDNTEKLKAVIEQNILIAKQLIGVARRSSMCGESRQETEKPANEIIRIGELALDLKTQEKLIDAVLAQNALQAKCNTLISAYTTHYTEGLKILRDVEESCANLFEENKTKRTYSSKLDPEER